MCLIITGPAQKVRESLLTTPGLLADVWKSNGDGIGAMHVSDDGLLVVDKTLAKSLDQAADFIARLPESDKDLAIHFRMRTHGDVDTLNCHPYPVVEGEVHMMHNGVLQIDDSSDKTKSDTWHYIDKVVRPQIEVAPQIIAVPAWQELVAEHIGNSNRLVFLDRSGKLVIVNKHLGIEHDGMWFSNEYAWSPELLIPDYYGKWGKWSGFTRYDENDYYKAWQGQHNFPTTTFTMKYQPLVTADELWGAVNDADADAVYKLLDEYPMSTLSLLFKTDRFVCSVELDELSTQDAKVVRMMEAADDTALARYCRKSAGRCRKVAEVIAWYGFWHSKDEEKPQLEVIDGEVVRVDELPGQGADEADLESWRANFQSWMKKQGILPQPKQPAKWTAQTPVLLQPPAQVAKVGIRTINYRGYRVEVPPELLEAGNVTQLRDHLEREVQRMHDEALAAKQPHPAEAVSEAAESNESYAG